MPLLLTPTPSPTLTGLTAAGALGGIKLLWTAPLTTELAFCEVWVSPTNDRSTATLAATIIGTSYFYQTATGNVRYFWVRSMNIYGRTDGTWAPSSATGGVVGTPSVITSADLDPNAIVPGTIQFKEFNDTSTSSSDGGMWGSAFVRVTTQPYSFIGTGAPCQFTLSVGNVFYSGPQGNPGTEMVNGELDKVSLECIVRNETTGVQIYDQTISNVWYASKSGNIATVTKNVPASFTFKFPAGTMTNGHTFKAYLNWNRVVTGNGTPGSWQICCSNRYCAFDAR